jgi:pimeloyl-ACP methyl ester carboxylesterase
MSRPLRPMAAVALPLLAAGLFATVAVSVGETGSIRGGHPAGPIARPLPRTHWYLTHHAPGVQLYPIRYRAWNGEQRLVVVSLPAWYKSGDRTALPLVIALHGRGGDARMPIYRWSSLPAQYGFAVVAPDGQGRRTDHYSYAAPGQIGDLGRMRRIVEKALPWVHIAGRHVFAVGASMGGQEALVLAARYPDRLAAAVSIDGVADLAARYWTMPASGRTPPWLPATLAREVGGTPRQAPTEYALRSPLTYVRPLAFDGVPLQIWWSRCDRTVIDQQTQSGRLARSILSLNPHAPVTQIVTDWMHGEAFRRPDGMDRIMAFLAPHGKWRSARVTAPQHWCYIVNGNRTALWGYSFHPGPGERGPWTVAVDGRHIEISATLPQPARLPRVAGRYSFPTRPKGLIVHADHPAVGSTALGEAGTAGTWAAPPRLAAWPLPHP